MDACPFCGEAPRRPTDAIKRLMHEAGLESEMCNPGGREFFFKTKGRLQISDMCASCDEKKIMEFITSAS